MGNRILLEHNNILHSLCYNNGVKSLFAFGSVVSDDFDEKKSDIDFVVELQKQNDPMAEGEALLNLWNGLEKVFARPVDLLRLQNIRNPILREEIERTKVAVYET